MRIVRFHAKYASQVFDLIKRCLIEVNSKDYPKDVIQFMISYFAPDKIVERSKNSIILVAIESGKVIGTATVNKDSIQAVFVDPNVHGSGMGSQLMHKAEQLVRKAGYGKVGLSSSITAFGFYQKLGYGKVEEKDERGFGKSILMTKNL
ncbi:GNAT family N-acetyltransferase [Candidatus Micrarchaeota archaeon]|nr:GNAT family N-acetyltransferase [Candidatus Micrarchaeota archaeon]